ncbi:MAG: hypothetical protein IJT41_00010 [Clostridia bacterium]|nr:hypothetical protein [Clostridia bacterium]
MYYKLLQNGQVVRVVERQSFLRWQEKHGMLVPCDEAYASGILGTDGVAYHVDGLTEIPLAGIETVQEIDRAEYIALADALGVEIEPKIEDVPILRAQLQAQSERNDFIEDCLLEMSEAVYG